MKRFIKVLSVIVAVIMLTGCFAPDVPTSQVDTEFDQTVLSETSDELSAEPLTETSSEEENITDNEDIGVTVYITDTGKKYHEIGCRYLWASSNAIPLKKAISNYYKPCSVCSPQE